MTSVLSPQNASLLRLARRSIRRDPKRSVSVAGLAGGPIGLLVAFEFAVQFRFRQYQLAITRDSLVVVGSAFLPLIVGVVVISAFTVAVRRRTRELGQLIVVGADPSHLRRIVVAEAMMAVAAGVIAGFAGGVAGFVIRSGTFGYNGNPVDAGSLGRLSIPLVVGLVVALAAALVPASRAASVSPIAALNARVPERRLRWWPILVTVSMVAGLLVWRTRIMSWENGVIFYWGVAMVWAGFAVLATGLPRVIRLVADQADRFPGVVRLAVRDVGRSVSRSSSLAIVALAVSLLGVMAVAGLESDRGVYDVMDARLITAPFEERAAADATVADLGAVAAVVDFEDLRELDRESPGYGPSFVAALTDEAIVGFGLSDQVLRSMPAGGAIVLDGQDWPLIGPNGNEIPAVVVDAGIGWQDGGGRDLPVALMRPADVADLPLFPGAEHMPAEDVAERAAMFDPAVRLYVLEEPLTDADLEAIWSGQSARGSSLGVAGVNDHYFGLDLDGFLLALVAVGLGIIVIAAVGLAKLGAVEVDTQLRPMLDMGAAPSLRRRFLAVQTGVLVLVGGVLGSGLGVVLFWLVTRGDASVPDPIVPWVVMLALSLGAALAAAGAVAVLFGPAARRSVESSPRR